MKPQGLLTRVERLEARLAASAAAKQEVEDFEQAATDHIREVQEIIGEPIGEIVFPPPGDRVQIVAMMLRYHEKLLLWERAQEAAQKSGDP